MTLPVPSADPPLRPSPDVVVEELDDELLLLRIGERDVLHLDPVASNVWRLLAQEPTERELAEALAEAYGQSLTRVAPDVAAALAVLRERRLLA